MTALTSRHEVPARPLKVLVPLIREEIDAGERAGIEHYRAAGQMLLEARAQITNRNEWFVWLKRNFKKEGKPLSETTANRYMQLAETFKESRGATRLKETFPTLSSFTHPERDSRHKVSWQEPVRESINKVNVERLVQDRQDKEKEERLVKEIALRLIDIGYRALAAKLHPDTGGSPEAMARLNKARDLLKAAV